VVDSIIRDFVFCPNILLDAAIITKFYYTLINSYNTRCVAKHGIWGPEYTEKLTASGGLLVPPMSDISRRHCQRLSQCWCHNHKNAENKNAAVAERLRDVSCLSVLNSTLPWARWAVFIIVSSDLPVRTIIIILNSVLFSSVYLYALLS